MIPCHAEIFSSVKPVIERVEGKETMKTRLFGYWATTSVLAFALIAGGVADLMHPQVIDEGMAHLGYPVYFATILGLWKIPGAVVLLAPRLPRVKEWAYAGAFFDMSGAVASHALSGDTFFQFLAPLIFCFCTVISWALRPDERVLGSLFRARKSPETALAHATGTR